MPTARTDDRIGILLERTIAIQESIKSLEETAKCTSADLANFRQTYAGDQAVMRGNQEIVKHAADQALIEAKSAHARIDALRKDFDDFKEKLGPVIFGFKVVALIGSLALASIFALVWGLITGSVTLGFTP